MGFRLGIGNIDLRNVRTAFSWSAYWASQNWGNYFCEIKSINTNKDTLIANNNPTFNYGIGINLAAGEYNTAATVTRTLIDFDLSSLVDDYVLENVTLNLWRRTDLADNTRKIQVFRMKKPWVEGSGNGSATGDGASWNTSDGTNAWQTAGAFGVDDCEQIAIGEFEIPHDMVSGWISIPLTVISKAELTLGYGFLLKMEVENNDGHLFRSLQDPGTTTPYIKYEIKKLINGTVSPLLTKNISNPLSVGCFGSVVYEGINQYFYFYCTPGNDDVYKRISTDGITWGAATVVMTSLGAELEVCSAWKEGNTHNMLYRSNEWGSGDKDIGLATSIDEGNTWTKYIGNPIITHADIGAWCIGDIDPWGIIKIGLTYYLWINDVNEIPRQSGLCTSTDLINWTMNANNPIFDNGRYCVTPIKYRNNYYLFVNYTPEGNVVGAYTIKYRIEIYRDSSPTFLPGEREFLGNVLLGGEDGEWDDDYLDTPSILTTTIQRDVFPAGSDKDGKLWMYYTGQDGINWSLGLAIGHLEMLSQLTAITEPGAGE